MKGSCAHVDEFGRSERSLGDEPLAGGARVLREVVGGAVRAADDLDPAVAHEALGVPAVARVVRHLVAHVLPEAHSLRIEARAHQEHVHARQEVAQRLVRHQFLARSEQPAAVSG